MIVIRLRGGLGNQLFQYALVRKLALERKTEFAFDIRGYATYPYHTYSLHPFAVQERIASESEIRWLKKSEKPFLVQAALKRFRKEQPYHLQSYVEEQHFHFDSNILKVPTDVYLDGYWQSEKYFTGIENLLRKEFKVRILPTEQNRMLGEKINAVSAVSLHIRRGDYVSNPVSLAFHGVCSLEYYRAAIARIKHMVKKPKFFVFSDDHAWVRNNVHMPRETIFVEHNDASKNYEDFRLMSLCRYHIIANSTFSWWAAWMNQSDNSVVIAPKKWFNNATLDTKDLFPKSWMVI